MVWVKGLVLGYIWMGCAWIKRARRWKVVQGLALLLTTQILVVGRQPVES